MLSRAEAEDLDIRKKSFQVYTEPSGPVYSQEFGRPYSLPFARPAPGPSLVNPPGLQQVNAQPAPARHIAIHIRSIECEFEIFKYQLRLHYIGAIGVVSGVCR